MALTDPGKKWVADNDVKTAAVWVGLSGAHPGAAQGAISETSGQGYARKQVLGNTGDRSVSNTGLIDFLARASTNIVVYTPSASGADDHSHAALFNAVSGADATTRLTDWMTMAPNVGAPVMGQPYRLTTLTLQL